jgi:hypothetical protein
MKALLLAPLLGFALLAAGVIGGGAPRAQAIEQCPFADVYRGGTLNGPLQVSGTCILSNVTLLGGVTVDANGHLILLNVRVEGGVTIRGGGELDTGTSAFSLDQLNTINGGITCANGGTFTIDTCRVR